MIIPITGWASRTASIGDPSETTWDGLREWVSAPRPHALKWIDLPEVSLSGNWQIRRTGDADDPRPFQVFDKSDPLDSFASIKEAKQWAEKRQLPGWSPARFTDNRRNRDSVVEVGAVVLDVDYGDHGLEALHRVLEWRALVHSSASSTAEHPKWRIIIAVDRPMLPEEYGIVWWLVRDALARGSIQLDEKTKDPSRLWFVPCELAEGEEYSAGEFDGEPLAIDEFIERAALQSEREIARPTTPSRHLNGSASTLARAPVASDTGLNKISHATRMKRAQGWIARAEPAVAGEGGHNAAMRVATALVRGFALDPIDAMVLFERWSATCDPPWSRVELDHKIAEAVRVGNMVFGEKLFEPAPVPIAPAAAPAPATANADDKDKEKKDPPAPPAPPPWSMVTVDDWWFTNRPGARRWLLRDARLSRSSGILPLGKVGEIVAEGGAGKTMMLIQLALAVTTGSKWLGAIDVAPEGVGKVLMLLGEEDLEEAHRRVYNAAQAMRLPKIPPSSLVIMPLSGVACSILDRLDRSGDLSDSLFLTSLRVYLKKNGPWKLVILDPLSRFAGSDTEKDNAAATRFIQALESLIEPSGDAAILLSHHTSKHQRGAGAQKTLATEASRGVSGITDGMRWVATLASETLTAASDEEREKHAGLLEIVRLSFTKSNYSAKGEPIELRRDLNNGGALVPIAQEDGETVDELRRRPQNDSTKEKERERDLREAKENEAVYQVVKETPGIPLRDLVKRVQAVAHIGAQRAEVAIARVTPSLYIKTGSRSAKLHYTSIHAASVTTVPEPKSLFEDGRGHT